MGDPKVPAPLKNLTPSCDDDLLIAVQANSLTSVNLSPSLYMISFLRLLDHVKLRENYRNWEELWAGMPGISAEDLLILLTQYFCEGNISGMDHEGWTIAGKCA